MEKSAYWPNARRLPARGGGKEMVAIKSMSTPCRGCVIVMDKRIVRGEDELCVKRHKSSLLVESVTKKVAWFDGGDGEMVMVVDGNDGGEDAWWTT